MIVLSSRRLAALALFGAAAVLLLMAIRVVSAVSLAEPLHVVTSGWEQESLYALWKFIHDGTVYADPYRVPFAASVYNWLFYEVYGGIIDLALRALALDEAWIPTLARLITLAATLAGTIWAYGAMVRDDRDPAFKALALAFAIFVFWGPLIGFWAATARPDVAAMALEVLAVFLFLRLWPMRPTAAVLAVAAALYAAWSMKQINVFAAIAVGLFLLHRRAVRPLVLFCVVLGGAVLATLGLGTPGYRTALFEAARAGFALEPMLRNVANFAVKSAPTLIPLVGLAIAALRSTEFRNAWLADDRSRLGLMGFVASLLLALPASAKIGASESYYFTLSFFAALATAGGLAEAMRSEPTNIFVRRFAAAGWALNIAAVALVVLGLQGVTTVRPQQARYLDVRRCVAELPTPIFVDDLYGSLPWINPQGPHFIVSFNYVLDRESGRRFENDGIGGMIGRGEFAALLLRGRPAQFDRGPIAPRYAESAQCGDFVAYRRRD